jgi:hypothetical protein
LGVAKGGHAALGADPGARQRGDTLGLPECFKQWDREPHGGRTRNTSGNPVLSIEFHRVRESINEFRAHSRNSMRERPPGSISDEACVA